MRPNSLQLLCCKSPSRPRNWPHTSFRVNNLLPQRDHYVPDIPALVSRSLLDKRKTTAAKVRRPFSPRLFMSFYIFLLPRRVYDEHKIYRILRQTVEKCVQISDNRISGIPTNLYFSPVISYIFHCTRMELSFRGQIIARYLQPKCSKKQEFQSFCKIKT